MKTEIDEMDEPTETPFVNEAWFIIECFDLAGLDCTYDIETWDESTRREVCHYLQIRYLIECHGDDEVLPPVPAVLAGCV